MKASDAKRAAILAAAYKFLDSKTPGRVLNEKPGKTWDFVGARIGFGHIGLGDSGDFDCVSISTWVDLDGETMRAAIPRLLDVISDELAKLGVTP